MIAYARIARMIAVLSLLAAALGFARIAAADDEVVFPDRSNTECKIACYLMPDGTEICPCDRPAPIVHSPEPVTMMLFGTGLAGLAAGSFKRRKRAA